MQVTWMFQLSKLETVDEAVAKVLEQAYRGPVLLIPRLSVSNPRILIGWARHAIHGQPALALLFGGVHATEM